MSFHWLVGDIIKEDAALATVPSRDRAQTTIRDDELDELLELHQEWVESKGASGSRLELTRADFEAADLTGVNLQGAILNGANFNGAELLLADLRGASLVQANLQETNLLGADLRGANLEGASLVGAAGLHTNQLAGAGLLWTILPAAISEFEGQQMAQARSRQCFRLLIATIVACALSWLRILTTRDVQFLNDAPLLRILPSSGILPISSFYMLMPIALFGLFVYLQISLQRLWERLSELPAVFPDGRTLDRTGPWLLMTLFHSRFRNWRANWIAPSTLQTIVPSGLAYWAVPATLLLFWVRYLVMQDVRGSVLQILLLLMSVGIAMQLPRVINGEVQAEATERIPRSSEERASASPANEATDKGARADADADALSESDSNLEPESIAESVSDAADGAQASQVTSMAIVPSTVPTPKESLRSHPAIRRMGVSVVVGAILFVLTLGVVYGVPHDTSVMPDFRQFSIKRWSADVFWTLGYRPYANLTETSVSQAPKNWSWQDDDLAAVKGAQLNNLRLRYAQGYRTFWANSHLWKADLQGAYFSESDFRGANLREANLRSVIFDRVQFFRANLQGSDLEKANLTRADLRETDLSYARMGNAILVDSRLGGANLFGADLRSASLAHANIEKADLRDANLSNANLKLADLQDAYLWSAQLPGAELQDADLSHAILIEANLQNSDLRGANLRGAVLRGTDLSGADIAGADFHGASGLTATQICSSKEHERAQLDEALMPLVEAQCGQVQVQAEPQAQPQAEQEFEVQPQPKS
ncbi:MAG: pentapeptide repeat-containing protein [Candidatus Acidiferrales bacterium]